ncbi:MAG: hypothetical protein ABI670_11560 [Chloroflexota bacterium]
MATQSATEEPGGEIEAAESPMPDAKERRASVGTLLGKLQAFLST